MKRITSVMRIFALLLIAFTTSTAFTSCVQDDDDFLFNDLLGQWEISSPVSGIIEFYSDGKGACQFIDDMGQEFYEDFDWWTQNPIVTIRNWDCNDFPTGDYNVYFGPNAVTLTPVGGGVPIVLLP